MHRIEVTSCEGCSTPVQYLHAPKALFGRIVIGRIFCRHKIERILLQAKCCHSLDGWIHGFKDGGGI